MAKKQLKQKKTREVLHPFIKTEIENSTGKPTWTKRKKTNIIIMAKKQLKRKTRREVLLYCVTWRTISGNSLTEIWHTKIFKVDSKLIMKIRQENRHKSTSRKNKSIICQNSDSFNEFQNFINLFLKFSWPIVC